MKVFISLFIIVYISCLNILQAASSQHPLQLILENIQTLENQSDPKCLATASRLENFMYGTPLTDKARQYKNNWQKKLILQLWRQDITQGLKEIAQISLQQNNNWLLQFNNTKKIIKANDLRQYSSVAYVLRAMLAVQQDSLLSASPLPALSKSAMADFKQKIELLTLALLQQADQTARLANRYKVNKSDLINANKILAMVNPQQKNPKIKKKSTSALLLKQIIQQKIASYQVYNKVSQPLFYRNLQVYFARLNWPKKPSEILKVKTLFTESLIQFTKKLYLGSLEIAQKANHGVIEEQDVLQYLKQQLPHQVNEYEDVIFFPALTKDQQITIEAYDMDAFRDSGLHWRYLESALLDLNKAKIPLLDSSPFAAELLSENIAQYGVLLFRMAGKQGQKSNNSQLTPTLLAQAVQVIDDKISQNNGSKPLIQAEQKLASSDLNLKERPFFENITQTAGINHMHRSAHWLNQLLRSYLSKSDKVGIITIPPAFGGSGVATEDINNDGWIDILILSGLGNHLYLNLGNGTFKDITQSAGLTWLRNEDHHPAEPRQPLIIDLDNDGWQDIVITYVNDNHRVYKNRGNGHFKEMTDIAKLGGKNSVAGPALAFDYNNDGLLDLYIAYFGDYLQGVLPTLKRRNRNGLANKLFQNMGNFKFKDVTQQAGVGDLGWGQALTHTDLNQDGWQDIIVGNDFGTNTYYINQKDGTFIDRAPQLSTDKPSYTMSLSTNDLNHDRIPDIYVSNIVIMNKDQKYVLPNEKTPMAFNPDKLANMRVVEANDLFLSSLNVKKQLVYQKSLQVGRGYSSTGWAWDADFFDADLDGDDDLYVLNGMNDFNLYSRENPYYTDPNNKTQQINFPAASKDKNVFFINQGGKLHNISSQSGLDLLSNSRSAAYFDFDRDGDLDIILNNYHEKAVLFKNNAERLKQHWLQIRALGDPAQKVNRDAIGTQIIVTTEQGHYIWREIRSSTGYLSAHPKIQYFGLGKATKANLVITWSNGQRQTIKNIPANQAYIIDQKDQSIRIYR